MEHYEDALCVQFMARMLQFKKDHKDDLSALKLTLEEFLYKLTDSFCDGPDNYVFTDGSRVVCYGNNQWVCTDYDPTKN